MSILPDGPIMDAPEIAAIHAMLDARQPARVLEWGAGASTLYWSQHYPDIEWVTLEHDAAWFAAVKERQPANVTLLHLPYPDYYSIEPQAIGRFSFIIVDGRERVRCLDAARHLLLPEGVALLHDSSRARYDEAVKYYNATRDLCPPNAKGKRGLRCYAQPRPPKVFGIGLPKTGTSSLNAALVHLGYNAKHYPHPQRVYGAAESLDALTDSPVIPHIEALARRYPGALFVQTVRPLDEWLASCEAHWQTRAAQPPIGFWNRRSIFGVTVYDPAIFTRVYLEYRARVTQFFAARADLRYLEMDICHGDGWGVLCPALGLSVPACEFPHINAAKKLQSA